MDLYFASTPFNLFSCLIVKEMNGVNADLIITDFAPSNYETYRKIKEYNIFDNVYFIEQKKFEIVEFPNENLLKKLKRKIVNRINNRLRFNKMFKKHFSNLPYVKKYDRLFFDSPNYVQRIIFNHYKQKNNKLICFRVDCGMETYFSVDDYNVRMLKLRDPTKKMMRQCKGVYLFAPEISDVKYPKIKIDIELYNKEFINHLFSYNENDTSLLNNKIIYFDQIFEFNEMNYKQLELFNQQFKNMNIVVKLHPRREDNCYNEKAVNVTSAFELILLNGPDISLNESILITPLSTAVFLPKILFDKEPYIICLLDVLGQEWIEGNSIIKFILALKSKYRDPDKVMVPKNFNELSIIMEKLKSNVE